jgi:hypothetical protein
MWAQAARHAGPGPGAASVQSRLDGMGGKRHVSRRLLRKSRLYRILSMDVRASLHRLVLGCCLAAACGGGLPLLCAIERLSHRPGRPIRTGGRQHPAPSTFISSCSVLDEEASPSLAAPGGWRAPAAQLHAATLGSGITATRAARCLARGPKINPNKRARKSGISSVKRPWGELQNACKGNSGACCTCSRARWCAPGLMGVHAI